jgi:hypothetical protein
MLAKRRALVAQPLRLKNAQKGFHFYMNANTTLQRVRDLARSKMLELPPMAGEE